MHSHSLRGRAWWAFAFLVAVLEAIAPAEAEVRLPNGEYTETQDDLRVKVLGGYVTVARSWTNGRWYVNPAWADLRLTFDSLDGSVLAIDRAGSIYERSGNGVYIFDKRFFVKSTTTGFRWYDQEGNWITYDAAGHMLAYGDRNDVTVKFRLDSSGRRIEVLDHFDNQVITFQYAGSQLASITDRTGRSVQYRFTGAHLTQVIDVLGGTWTYGYDGNGQITSRTDPAGNRTAIAYAQSTPAASSEGLSGNAAVGRQGATVRTASSTGTATTGASARDYKIARVFSVTDPEGNVTTYSYEYDRVSLKYKVVTTLPTGSKQTSVYDRDGRLLEQSPGSRRTYLLRRDGDRVELITDERGLTTRVEYNAARQPVKMTYADGSSVSMTYDSVYGNVLSRTDEAGIVTAYAYDGRGNLIRKTDAAGLPEQRVTTYAYDAFGQRVSTVQKGVTPEDDAATTFTYDAFGNIVRLVTPVGSAWTYTHDIEGNTLVKTDPRGNAWTSTYNAAGWELTRKDPLGHAYAFEYDPVGKRVRLTDPAGYVIRIGYNRNGWLTSITDALGGVTRFEYDEAGRRTRRIDAAGITTTTAYDLDGRPTKAIDGSGNVTQTLYGDGQDGLDGLVAAIVYPTYTKQFKYDQRNRLTQVTVVLDAQTRYVASYGYDSRGNPVSMTDPLGRTSITEFDALNRKVAVVDPLGGVTRFAYNTRSDLLRITDAKGQAVEYVYDTADQMLSERNALGAVTQFTYDAAGNRTARKSAEGDEQRWQYDAANRLTREDQYRRAASTPDRSIAYRYDARNLLEGYDDGTTSATYAYDLKGGRTSESINYGSFAKTLGRSYRANGAKSGITYPDGTSVTYGYDAGGRLASIGTPAGPIEYSAYRWLHPGQASVPGSTTSLAYDGLMRLVEVAVQANGAGSPGSPQGAGIFAARWQYDGAGNALRKVTEEGTFEYGYDALDRLISATPPLPLQASPANPDGLPVERYTYDLVFNRITSQHQPGPWIYNPANQLVQFGSGVGLTSYEYDANGLPTRRVQGAAERVYRYDAAGRLEEIKENGSQVASYYYDPFGRRLRKSVGAVTTYFQYSDEGLVAEYDANGAPLASYGWKPDAPWGSYPQYKVSGGQAAFYHSDHLGTPQRMSNASGDIAWSGRAEAFGLTTVTVAKVDNPLRLPGQYFDSESATHYNFHRTYDPSIGRYREFDPAGLKGGINAYAYVNAAPTKYGDPLGLWIPPYHRQMGWQGAFGGGCGKRANEIGAATAAADSDDAFPGTQDPDHSYMHSMCDGNNTRQDSMEQFIFYLDYLEKLRNSCEIRDLGLLLHAIQDSYSPAHSGFQCWEGMAHWGTIWHGIQDTFGFSGFYGAVAASSAEVSRFKARCKCVCD